MSILSTEFRDETLEITDDCKKNRDILNGVLGERSILNTCFGIWVFSRHYILFRGHYKKIFRFGLNSYASVTLQYPAFSSRVFEMMYSPLASRVVPTISHSSSSCSSTTPLASMTSPASACPA